MDNGARKPRCGRPCGRRVQRVILSTLSREGPLTFTQIVCKMGIRRDTLGRALRALHKRGAVQVVVIDGRAFHKLRG